MPRRHLASLLILLGTATAQPAAAARPATPDMVRIDGGSFAMGKMVDRGYGQIDGPTRTVAVAPFRLASKEVTLGEFRAFVAATGHVSKGKCNVYDATTSWHVNPDRNWEKPGFEQAENHPVVCVSWDDAQAYAAWIGGQTGHSFRLPSEAETEYVATRAHLGSAAGVTHDNANIGKVECCGGKAEGKDKWIVTAPVGSFAADRFGLYDIRGNVSEWQGDCYNGDYVGAPSNAAARQDCIAPGYRSIRGGSYGDAGEFLDPLFRLRGTSAQGYFTVGFRLAETIR